MTSYHSLKRNKDDFDDCIAKLKEYISQVDIDPAVEELMDTVISEWETYLRDDIESTLEDIDRVFK